MRQYPLPIALAVFLLVGAGCLGAGASRPKPLVTPPVVTPTTPTPSAITSPPATPRAEPPTGGHSGQSVMTDNVIVNAPTIGATVASPLTITGEARGPWYFEGSFPVQVKNSSGVVIGSGIAHEVTPGTWMTVDFVPFTSTISFAPQPAGSAGTVVLIKDDPSGENPDSVTISITF